MFFLNKICQIVGFKAIWRLVMNLWLHLLNKKKSFDRIFEKIYKIYFNIFLVTTILHMFISNLEIIKKLEFFKFRNISRQIIYFLRGLSCELGIQVYPFIEIYLSWKGKQNL